jgi:hypothetical protein
MVGVKGCPWINTTEWINTMTKRRGDSDPSFRNSERETFMHIDVFWTGVAVGAISLFVMEMLMIKVIYPWLERRRLKKGDSA